MNIDEAIASYEERTPGSIEANRRAKKHVPGGVSANIKYFEPYPVYMKGGHGAWLEDVDGNKYVDYLLSYGPLILGHAHPAVKEAIETQINENGSWLYGTPNEFEAQLAERICSYYPSIEMLRYTNSGTEATLLAIRFAYAFTGKYKIGKFEGHYHGGYNQVLISVNPNLKNAGDKRHPNSLPESLGLEPWEKDDTIVLPFNDLEACEEILRAHKDDMAAIIMEPVLTGYVPATKEFMVGLRKITQELGILMIIDEVKTGFRTAMNGAQGYYGIKPDLTTLGKVLGAGFPMGVVGGRKDILRISAPLSGSDVFDPSLSDRSNASDVLFHSGTYNGHPFILRCGLATLDVLDKEFDKCVERTDTLRAELEKLFKAKGIPMQTVGLGTVFNILLTEQKILGYRDIQTSDFKMRKLIDFALLSEGIYNKPTNRYSLSVAHDDSVIDFTVEAYKKVLAKI